jgi:hypothetical protein
MRISNWKSAAGAITEIIGIAVLLTATAATPNVPAEPSAQQITLNVDPAQSHVHYAIDSTLHTVHGTFALKNGSVRIDQNGEGFSGGTSVFVCISLPLRPKLMNWDTVRNILLCPCSSTN